MKKTAVKLVAVLATAILALTGCAKNNPNVAATVGDQTIKLTQVDAVAKSLVAKDPTVTWGAARHDVAQVMVVSRLAKLAQDEVGVKVTDAQRQQVYAAYPAWEPLLKDPVTATFMADFADYILVMSNQTAASAYQKVAANVPVSVNPIFGSWDPATGQFAGNSGSLSEVFGSPKS
jgi:ABC-type Fe3+-hydroxamate transport system substrate-binding protein